MEEQVKQAEVKGTDLSSLDTTALSNRGIEVTIYNPKTDEDTDIKIRILGQDSDEYRKWQRKSTAKNLSVVLQGNKRRRDVEETLLESAEDTIPQQLAITTLGWTGVLKDGKEFPFSQANAVWLYTNSPVIRDQVLAAQRDRANFLAS